MPPLLRSVILSVLFGVLLGVSAVHFSEKPKVVTKEDLIRGYYETENAVIVSPHSLRKRMDKGDTRYTLVDLRSAEEYRREHIVGAVNIPAYQDPDTSAYDDVERILTAFQTLPDDQEIIVYCYSRPCMTGRKIGLMLAENGVFVKHLGIGWNEWRHDWTSWNHEHEWAVTRPEDYVRTGDEPGVPISRGASEAGCTGPFGC